jgi:hypothetical protein
LYSPNQQWDSHPDTTTNESNQSAASILVMASIHVTMNSNPNISKAADAWFEAIIAEVYR